MAEPGSGGPRAPAVRTAARTEQRKLIAQLPLRVLTVVCVLGPLVFAILLKVQSGTPSDALFGAWVHTSGFAVSLVILSFAANWGFPIMAGVLAGDLFAGEDRQGTWKTILTRSRTLSEIFAGKVLTAMVLALALGTLLAVSGLVAGVVLVGAHPLTDLGGRELSPGHVLVLVATSWLVCLPPLLAYTSLAVLFSVASRNGIIGVLGPVVVALVTQLLNLIGKGVWVHLLLIGSAFDGWHGLFAAHAFLGPLVVSLAVSVLWIAAALGAAWRILERRDFVSDAETTRTGWQTPIRIALGATLIIGLLALASSLGPAGVTARRLTASLAPEFRRLTLIQQALLGHPIPAGTRYRILPTCGGRGAKREGPGDWTCTMNVYVILPGGTQPLTDTPVSYDVSVQSNGCYKASSPPAYVGQAQIRDRRGQLVVNPLVTIYGCLNIL
ncbi:MAG TPA: ABC transporter permease [Solirubrobacteraceae bacterium]